MTILTPRENIRHAWREPLRGAIQDWRRFWYIRVGWSLLLGTVFAVIYGFYHRQANVTARVLPFSWVIALGLVGLYAFIQRIVELYDEKLVVRQGRGGDTYYFSSIRSVLVRRSNETPSIVVCPVSGKGPELFMGPELSLDTVIQFLANHGVSCIDDHLKVPNQSKDPAP